MSRRKAHHKVPRFYLEGFRTDDSGTGKKARIWVYREGESEPRRCNPSKTGFETDFYSVIGPDGQRDPMLEELLDTYVDTPTSRIWHKLEDRSEQLEVEDRLQIAVFIAFLFTRTSSIRRVMEDASAQMEEMTRKMMAVAEQRTGDPSWKPLTATPTAGARGYVIRNPEDLRLTHNDFVQMTGVAVESIATIIAGMNWTRFHGPADVSFITSDNPVSRENPFVDRDWLSADITRDGAEVSVPISKHCGLVCSHHGPETHVSVEADAVNILNQRTLRWSESEVYASRREAWLDSNFFGDRSD